MANDTTTTTTETTTVTTTVVPNEVAVKHANDPVLGEGKYVDPLSAGKKDAQLNSSADTESE